MSPQEGQAPERQQVDDAAGAEVAGDTGAAGEQNDPEALREEIRQTREELGDTVEALTEKADVKAQAKAKVDESKERLGEAQEQAKTKAGELGRQARGRPVSLITAGVVVALLVLWLIRRD